MHVAILAGSLSRGGTERVIVNLAEYMIGCGDTVTLVTQFLSENEYELPNGVSRIISGLTDEETTKDRIKNILLRHKKLKNIWIDIKPDIILSFIGKNNFMAVSTAKGLNIPVAVCVRALPELEYPNPLMKALTGLLFTKADAVILQTAEQKSFFSARVKRRAYILKNPIDSAFLRKPYEGIRDKEIVSVGRIDENKNHRMIIDAFAPLTEKYPDWRVKIYGEGQQRDELIRYVKERGLEQQISLPGRISDVAGSIEKASIFILSSDTEGSPNALIEAMCLGICCISTDCPCGGPAELIENNTNGILIPVRGTDKLQEVLQNLLGDLQRIDKIGHTSLKTRDIYNPEAVLGSWRELLENLVNTRRTL